MPDIISLLPDKVANQIAAGEVIQRPASAVKELLENAIDSGATKIELIIKDAGKTLIQVNDNGCGMTNTDARMCFERHATSKIKKADDLFAIKTKGFRGEALASIAAIAQVTLKTKLCDDELATQIEIEGSKITNQEPVMASDGTSFQIKNLFFNVPARRNFLKSNAIETKHIIDEFERVALTHPEIHFTFYNNDSEVFNLPEAPLRKRIVNILGNKYNERLVPIEESTPILHLTGYVVKPEHSKRTRGEQFFFVNNRFIKNSYLNHAVTSAYTELISKDQFPSYFLYLDVAPNSIDINIHPTKTEIKFEDERSIYAIIHSSVKNSLGKYNISPSLDFEQETSFNVTPLESNQPISAPTIKVNPDYNPFQNSSNERNQKQVSQKDIQANLDLLSNAFTTDRQLSMDSSSDIETDESDQNWEGFGTVKENKTWQLQKKYILSQISSGLLIIDQHRAHVRVLYDKYENLLEHNQQETQRLLFNEHIELNSGDFSMIQDILPQLQQIGFEIDVFGKNTIAISGLPTGIKIDKGSQLIELFLDQIKNHADFGDDLNKRVAWGMAKSAAIRKGIRLTEEEMNTLLDELFACSSPYYAPNGKPIIVKIDDEELIQRFK